MPDTDPADMHFARTICLAKCTFIGGLDPLLRAVPSASAYVVGEAEETAVPNQAALALPGYWQDADPRSGGGQRAAKRTGEFTMMSRLLAPLQPRKAQLC
jgi:hypothetical protein